MKRTDAAGIALISEIRQLLWQHYGPLHWWPGDSPDEIAIGAVLTQNTAWQNVEKAIANMKEKHILSFPAILKSDTGTLAESIRPAGYFNQKARKLKALAKVVCQNGGNTIFHCLSGKKPAAARDMLLNIWGIGMETADSILLYAIGLPIFVVDTYTRRIFSRHGIADLNVDYETLRKMVEISTSPDTEVYNEFHAGLVHLGKDFCHRRSPDCRHCPLASMNNNYRKTEE